MSFVDSPLFVFLVMFAFVPLFGAAWLVTAKFPRNGKNVSILSILLFFGAAFLLVDVKLISATYGDEAWKELFHYNTALFLWIPLFLTPFITYLITGKDNNGEKILNFGALIITFIVTTFTVFVGSYIFFSLHDLFIQITQTPR